MLKAKDCMGARKSKSHSVAGNRVALRKRVSGRKAREKIKEQKVKQINKGESKMNILEETMKHFELKEQPKQEEQTQEEDRFAGFGSYYAGGQRVIDLTSVDEDYTQYELKHLASDIERQQIYGDKAGDPNRM